jgi:excisionase family DNA binding protein
MRAGDLLTTKEAAELLRVSHWTVSAWLSQGKLKRVKAGGRTLIAKTDLEAFLTRSDSKTLRNQGEGQTQPGGCRRRARYKVNNYADSSIAP